jgi:hypothetical protein
MEVLLLFVYTLWRVYVVFTGMDFSEYNTDFVCKKYVGQTGSNFETRYKEHTNSVRKNKWKSDRVH